MASIFDVIDPAKAWKTEPSGTPSAANDLSETTVPAAASSSSGGAPFFSPKHQHFGFLMLLAGTGSLIYWIYEGKPSGALVRGNVGPLEGEVGAGVGKE